MELEIADFHIAVGQKHEHFQSEDVRALGELELVLVGGGIAEVSPH